MNNQPQGKPPATFPGYKQAAAVLRGAHHNSRRPHGYFFAVSAEPSGWDCAPNVERSFNGRVIIREVQLKVLYTHSFTHSFIHSFIQIVNSQ